MSTSLTKGANAPLGNAEVQVDFAIRGSKVDLSALLLGEDRKVRADSDLVFYNNPSRDGVELAGESLTVSLSVVPADVAAVVAVLSIDPASLGSYFSFAPTVSVQQGGATVATFTPPDFTDHETVILLVEVYRRGERWKVRAVGQGYATGLAGLAKDYGVDVEEESTANAGSVVPPVALEKIAARAPSLLGPAQQASRVLAESGVGGRRASLHLILSHDYGMEEMYESFAIQAFAERILALAINLDDDGTVPVIFSGDREPFIEDLNLSNFKGRIGQLHTQVDWGWGYILQAMRQAVSSYQSTGASEPAVVIVQVSDDPSDKAEIRSLLQNTALLGVFWIFVGFGKGKLSFYKNLDASNSAKFPNVAFYDAGKNPGATPDDAFYSGLVAGLARWLG